MAGSIQDQSYFETHRPPRIDGERVEYLGPVGPRRRQTLLAGASALVHLVNFAEPFGLSVVEAMACGTPVIARPRGSMPEIIRKASTAFSSATPRRTRRALELADTLDRRQVRESVEARFGVERMVDEYLALYRRIVAVAA